MPFARGKPRRGRQRVIGKHESYVRAESRPCASRIRGRSGFANGHGARALGIHSRGAPVRTLVSYFLFSCAADARLGPHCHTLLGTYSHQNHIPFGLHR
jgi:hypothetical protein